MDTKLKRGRAEAWTQGYPSLLSSLGNLLSTETVGISGSQKREWIHVPRGPPRVGLEKWVHSSCPRDKLEWKLEGRARGWGTVGTEAGPGQEWEGGPGLCQEEGWVPWDTCVIVLTAWGSDGDCSYWRTFTECPLCARHSAWLWGHLCWGWGAKNRSIPWTETTVVWGSDMRPFALPISSSLEALLFKATPKTPLHTVVSHCSPYYTRLCLFPQSPAQQTKPVSAGSLFSCWP